MVKKKEKKLNLLTITKTTMTVTVFSLDFQRLNPQNPIHPFTYTPIEAAVMEASLLDNSLTNLSQVMKPKQQ